MEKYQTIVLITFGTSNMPNIDDFQMIIDAVKLADPTKIGFIVGLKKEKPAYKMVKELNLQNILLDKWIPQKELLSLPKTRLFITHCGMNSIYESIYFGAVPMLGFSQAADQHGNNMRNELLNIGKMGSLESAYVIY